MMFPPKKIWPLIDLMHEINMYITLRLYKHFHFDSPTASASSFFLSVYNFLSKRKVKILPAVVWPLLQGIWRTFGSESIDQSLWNCPSHYPSCLLTLYFNLSPRDISVFRWAQVSKLLPTFSHSKAIDLREGNWVNICPQVHSASYSNYHSLTNKVNEKLWPMHKPIVWQTV